MDRWGLLTDFAGWAHDGQLPPDGDWRVWLIRAGRGFGQLGPVGAGNRNSIAFAGGLLAHAALSGQHDFDGGVEPRHSGLLESLA